jgi:DNA repair protein RadC
MTMTKNDTLILNDIPLYHVELVRDRSILYKSCQQENEVGEILHQLLDKSPVEKLVALHMDSLGKLVGVEVIAVGTIDSVTSLARDIFRGAIVCGVPRIILGHNHPSGKAFPSTKDVSFTAKVATAGMTLGIQVWDHIIVSPQGDHYSMMNPDNQEEMTQIMHQVRMEESMAMMDMNGIIATLTKFSHNI